MTFSMRMALPFSPYLPRDGHQPHSPHTHESPTGLHGPLRSPHAPSPDTTHSLKPSLSQASPHSHESPLTLSSPPLLTGPYSLSQVLSSLTGPHSPFQALTRTLKHPSLDRTSLTLIGPHSLSQVPTPLTGPQALLPSQPPCWAL